MKVSTVNSQRYGSFEICPLDFNGSIGLGLGLVPTWQSQHGHSGVNYINKNIIDVFKDQTFQHESLPCESFGDREGLFKQTETSFSTQAAQSSRVW